MSLPCNGNFKEGKIDKSERIHQTLTNQFTTNV